MASNATRPSTPAGLAWHPPLGPERYDRRPLSPAERAARAVLADEQPAMNRAARRMAEATLGRLSRPLHEVYALRCNDTSHRALATRLMFRQMHQRDRAFWHWSAHDWGDVVGATAAAFKAANPPAGGRTGLRPHLLDVAYLLCGFETFGPLWAATAWYPMARVVFGVDLLDDQLARLHAVLANEGYASGHASMKHRHQAIAFALLLNRSPWLADLSWDVLDRAAAIAPRHVASILRDCPTPGKVAQLVSKPWRATSMAR